MKMTKKYLFYGLGIILLIVLILSQTTTKKTSLSLEVIQIEDGWGYEVLIDHKIYISQKCIPVIDGNQAFQTKNDALKVGELLVRKLKNKLTPTITREELINLKIKI